MTSRTKSSRTFRFLAFGALVLGAALLPRATRGAMPCAADIEKFCAKVPIGSGRVQKCLKEHEKELSPECAAHHANLEKQMGTLAAICREDIARHCSDVAPGGGRIARCLEQHRSDLTPLCADRLASAQKPAAK